MYLHRMIFCMVMLYVVAPLSGMNKSAMEQYSADRSSSPLINNIDVELNSPSYVDLLSSAQGYRVACEPNPLNKPIKVSMKKFVASFDSDNSEEDNDKSDSESDTWSDVRLNIIDEINKQHAEQVYALVHQTRTVATQTVELLDRINARARDIDRTSVNIIGNIMECGKCFGGWLIYTASGVVGPSLVTSGIIRMMRESNIDTSGTDENHIDIEGSIAVASGTVMTVCAVYGWTKHIMTPNGPRPVQTHDV